MRRKIDLVVLASLIVGVGFFGYVYREQLQVFVRQLEAQIYPCQSPISYSIGSIDARFGITEKILIADLKKAEMIWEVPPGKDLFEHRIEGGDVIVNFVYDSRQAATDTLQAAGIQIEKSKTSYDTLKMKYDSLSAQLQARKIQYEQSLGIFEKHEAAYNASVQSWNERGGAPKRVYDQLQEEKAVLQEEVRGLRVLQDRLNSDIETTNALATTLNQRIVQLNLNVQQYNQVGASQGEFEEGLYVRAAGVQRIDIYEYSSHNVLVRLLAHEMGHALGIDHVADPRAIMYKINQSERTELAPDDIAALDSVCTSGNF